ncbi:MAG: PQQ-dependent sugar dehydrogenase [Desulfobacterales bacterium]|jgi:glucose/arabinose dehydrogenase
MKPRLAFVMILFFFVMCSDRLLAQPYITQSDVPAERGFRAVALLGGLEHPWSMVWLPNGDILVTERPGRLRRVRDGRLASGSIAGVPEVFDSGQGGLLDISLHPRFEQNRRVYFTYAYGSTIANRTRVATAVLNSDRLKKWQVIFEVAANKFGGQHFGSRLLWLPDETLLVSIGDGGNPPVRLEGDWIRKQAQNRRSHLGKILRFKDNGSVPPDNPFVNSADLQTTIWSYGHRNIQGLAYDPIRSMVWASEHGALGGDELNLIQAGRNYGWPTVTFSREYFDGSKISPHTSKPGMVDPVAVWMTAIAPSGLVVYSGTQFEQWRGDLFVGGLKSQDIRRIDLNEAGQVVGQSALRIGQRVRDVRQGPDGLLYVLTDESNGSLIRLEPASDKDYPPSP